MAANVAEKAWEAAEDDNGDAPVSSDEVARRRLVRRTHFTTIIAAWIITVPAAALLAAVTYGLLRLFA